MKVVKLMGLIAVTTAACWRTPGPTPPAPPRLHERVLHTHRAEREAMLEIFGEHTLAPGGERRLQDQRVP